MCSRRRASHFVSLQTQSFLLDLFFPHSDEDVASAFAGNVIVLYWRWQSLLNKGLKGDISRDELTDAAEQLTNEANEQHNEFCSAANRAIRGRAF
jgi:hypothetical protein